MTGGTAATGTGGRFDTRVFWRVLVALLVAAGPSCAAEPAGPPEVTIGSKQFTESVVLGELLVQLARSSGARVRHRRALGGTRLLWDALRAGQIDAYVEYTGTLREEIFRGRGVDDDRSLRRALASEGIVATRPLGFDDTYAIGMREERAAALAIRTLSDLARHPELRLGLSHELVDRADGWPGLRDRYGLGRHAMRGLDHDLAYRALASGEIDVTDLYSTDAEIRHYGLRVLADDRGYFPAYRAIVLVRRDLARRAPAVLAALRRLEGRIDEAAMIAMNARAKLDRVPEARVAADYARQRLAVAGARSTEETRATRLLRTTAEHLTLVALALAAAIVVALPLGVLCARRPRLGQVVLSVAGVVQTVPSLALLVFMIPLLGIGGPPAVVALFLYGLLPIVRSTATGLRDIPASLRESAEALGLPPRARLRLVELPLASRAILSGVKTAAVITVGTATLGALVGAGGYGQPILTGIRLDDVGLILEGAVPAAALALAVQGLFDLAERWLVPRGLR